MSLTIPVQDIVTESNDPLLTIHPSWERVPLDAIAEILNGFAFKSAFFNRSKGMPLLRIRDVGKDRTECFYEGPYELRYVVQAGDLIVGMDGDFKCARWTGPDALLNQRACKIELKTTDYEPSFLNLVLPGYLRAINERTSSQTVKHLSSQSMAEIPLPLPPLGEQKRIVAKVEELLTWINAIKEHLTKVSLILKHFRQAVLAAACSGRLTAAWREKKLNVEPVDNLIRRIRDKRLKEAKSSREKERIINLCEESRRRSVHNNFEQDLPESWAFCEVNELGDVCNGSTPSRKHPEYWGGGIPWISSGEIQNNIINETRETISKEGYKNSSVRMLPVGTVLLAMIGEGKTRGQTAILNLGSTINQNIAAVIIDHGLISSKYLWYWFQFQYEITRQVGGGSGPQALNCQRVRELSLNLPPLGEQDEISSRVESLFELADTIEKRVAAASLRAEKLTQSFLAKAFRGELVLTEAELARRERRSYESASDLLDRIKAERESKEASERFYRSEKRRKSGGFRPAH